MFFVHYSQINYILWSFAPKLSTDCGHFSEKNKFFLNFFKKFQKSIKFCRFFVKKEPIRAQKAQMGIKIQLFLTLSNRLLSAFALNGMSG